MSAYSRSATGYGYQRLDCKVHCNFIKLTAQLVALLSLKKQNQPTSISSFNAKNLSMSCIGFVDILH